MAIGKDVILGINKDIPFIFFTYKRSTTLKCFFAHIAGDYFLLFMIIINYLLIIDKYLAGKIFYIPKYQHHIFLKEHTDINPAQG